MKKLYVPSDESELAVIRSLLDSVDIPYYIRNEYFGSLYIGPAMGSFNSKPIFVHEEFYNEAKEVLSELIKEEDFASTDDNEAPTFLDGIYNFFKNYF
ncbi:MAG: DUF2007 domain-containing protein [Thermodesulfobacteriota bacterium]